MSVTDGQHKVPIAIQRPNPSRRLAPGGGRPSGGSLGPGPSGARPAAPAQPASPGAAAPAQPARAGAGAASPGGRAGPGRAAEADTRITLLQAPGWGWGGRGVWKLRARRTSVPLPSFSAVRVTSLYGQRKKIIKKTYKITIEKVILLGEAPLRLRGAFVLLIYFFFKWSFPSAT